MKLESCQNFAHASCHTATSRALSIPWRSLPRPLYEAGDGPHPENARDRPDGKVLSEYSVDVPTPREMRAIEQQAAQECGQWQERSQVTQVWDGNLLSLTPAQPISAAIRPRDLPARGAPRPWSGR